MIDEQRTLEIYDYISTDLSYGSGKKIVAVCDGCGKYRILEKRYYRDLCNSCRQKITQNKLEIKEKNRQRSLGKKHSKETKEKMSKNHADVSGENSPFWKGGITDRKYCLKFNNRLKTKIRNKYNNCDYVSGLHKDVCNNGRNLDVHHVDYNKDQGCDGTQWKLIPLSNQIILKQILIDHFGIGFLNIV